VSRLTELEKLPKPDEKSVGAFQFRRLKDFVLAADDGGRFAFLSDGECREFLKGLAPDAPARGKVGDAGLLRDAYDFDEAAAGLAERSLLSWPGPAVHVVRLAAGAAMTIETARAVVDFAFTVPGPTVAFELVCDSLDDEWPLVWFLVQYARRRGEWHKRSVELTVRLSRAPAAKQAEYLRDHRVELRAVLAPDDEIIPGARRAIVELASPLPKDPAKLIDRLAEGGVESVLLFGGAQPGFLKFYEAAIDRMLQVQGRLEIREELAAGLLSGRRWRLPGFDLLGELCYRPDGGIYTSELAAMLGPAPRELLNLGDVGSTRYSDFAKSPAVQAILATSLSENQPMCAQCAYRPFCAIPPSENLRAQGTLWGRHPSSAACSLNMSILDLLFARLARTESAEALRQWLG
jgi:hypothetical protein